MADYYDSQISTSTTESERTVPNWWAHKPKTQFHEDVWPYLNALMREQRHRFDAHKLYFGMYAGAEPQGLSGAQYAQRHRSSSVIRVNVTRSLCSAATSKIAKNKPRVLYLTEGGNWSQMQRGKRLTKIINGMFDKLDLYSRQQEAFLNGCIFDMGNVYVYRVGKEIMAELVGPGEIIVDDGEARYGEPRQAHRIREVSRDVLKHQYPKHKEAIAKAPRASSFSMDARETHPDTVLVAESWHLKSGEGAKDGWHVVSLPNVTLSSEPYKYDYFPWTRITWEQMPLGYYGQGLPEQLLGLQYNINKTVQDIQDHSDKSTGFVYIDRRAKIAKKKLTNAVWNIVEGDGSFAPQMITPSTFPPEKLQWLQFLIEWSREETGISSLMAQGQKPDLKSGKALRIWNDLESARFQICEQRFENSFLHLACVIQDLLEEIAEEFGGVSVKTGDGKFLREIDWKKARLDKEEFTVKVVPTSFLPSTPAGKLETIEEMLAAGLLSREEALLLLDYPDLERINKRKNAPLLYIEKQIEGMLDEDEPVFRSPEPFQPHDMCIKVATEAYQEAQMAGAPDVNLELLRRYINRASDYMKEQQAPAAPPVPMQAGGPMPAPGMMPPAGALPPAA